MPASIAGVQRIARVHLAKIVIREIERNRSFKILNLFAESVGQAGQSAAVHPQRVILLLNVAGGNPAHVGHPANHRPLSLHNFRRTVPNRGWRCCVTRRGDGVGFYHLAVIHFRTKAALGGVLIGRQRVRTDLHAIGHARSAKSPIKALAW